MKNLQTKLIITCVSSVLITACGQSKDEPIAQAQESVQALTIKDTNIEPVAQAEDLVSEQWKESEELNQVAEQLNTKLASADQSSGSRDIPYPVYPNASKYRIGGENGLRIVLFQTEDSFQEVDAYFQEQADLARLGAMPDYVRYSTSSDDNDPWATNEPGIVIHEFNNESEKSAVGADETARTNIIMSY